MVCAVNKWSLSQGEEAEEEEAEEEELEDRRRGGVGREKGYKEEEARTTGSSKTSGNVRHRRIPSVDSAGDMAAGMSDLPFPSLSSFTHSPTVPTDTPQQPTPQRNLTLILGVCLIIYILVLLVSAGVHLLKD